MDVPAVVSAIGQIGSTLVAIPAAVVAYYAWRSSQNTARSTEALTAIEHARLHAELRPQFTARAFRLSDRKWPDIAVALFPGIDRGNPLIVVRLELVGPPALHHLESIKVRMRPYWGSIEDSLPGWVEPYEFLEPDPMRKTVFDVILGDAYNLLMRANHERGAVQPRRAGPLPIRLTLECRSKGFDPWTVPITVKRIEPNVGDRFVDVDPTDTA